MSATSVVDSAVLLRLTFTFYIVGGHIGFPTVLIAAVILRNGARHPVFLNLCLAWVLSSISFSILFYFGQASGEQPPFTICLLQSAAVFAAQILLSLTMLALVLHLWFTLTMEALGLGSQYHRRRTYVLLILPHVLAFASFITIFVSGAIMAPKALNRPVDSYFCIWPDNTVQVFHMVLTVAISVTILLFECLIAKTLIDRRKAILHVEIDGHSVTAIFLRVTMFALLGIGFVVVSLLASLRRGSTPMIIQASLVTLSFLLLGTRPDLYKKPARGKIATSNSPSKPIPINLQTQDLESGR